MPFWPPVDEGVKRGLAEWPWLAPVHRGPCWRTSFRPLFLRGHCGGRRAPWALPILPAPDPIPEAGALGAGRTHPSHESPGLPHSGRSAQDSTQGQEPGQADGCIEGWVGTERRRVRGAPDRGPQCTGLHLKSTQGSPQGWASGSFQYPPPTPSPPSTRKAGGKEEARGPAPHFCFLSARRYLRSHEACAGCSFLSGQAQDPGFLLQDPSFRVKTRGLRARRRGAGTTA